MPLNINLLSDDTIARGITPPDIGNFGTALTGTQDYFQKQALQNLFAGGLPKDPNDPTGRTIDWSKAMQMALQVQGAPGLPGALALRQADIQQQAISGIQGGGSSVFSPPPLPQGRTEFPPSVQRSGGTPQETSSVDPDQGSGGVSKPPGQNAYQESEVPGSARMSVDGGPMMALASEPQPAPTVRQFSQNPVTGPPTERFTPPTPPQQVAQAQPRSQYRDVPPPTQQSPIPPGEPGFNSLENAAVYEDQAGRASKISAILGASGLQAAAAGYKQQSDHLYETAKQIREHLGKVGEEREKARLKVEGELPTKLAEHSVTQIAKTYEKAQTFAEGVPATQNLLDQINSKSGIFSGKWATQRLAWAKIGEVVGVPDDRVMPTEAYQSLVGRKVAATVKSFGSGTSITNQDREYASNMEGGNINLDESSMRRILTLSDQVARDQIKNHNRDVDKLQKVYPAAPLGNFKVEEPPKLAGRTTEPKPGPPGAIPPAPSMEQRQPNQVYQTPKGPARWRGTGWELVR